MNILTATASYANTSASIVVTRTHIMPLLQNVVQNVSVMYTILATIRSVQTIPKNVQTSAVK